MRTVNQKTLIACALVAVSVLCGATGCLTDTEPPESEARVLDLRPRLYLDLNSDDSTDFYLHHIFLAPGPGYQATYDGTYISVFGENYVLQECVMSEKLGVWFGKSMAALGEGISIGPSMPDSLCWLGDSNRLYPKGNGFDNPPPKYLGLRFGSGETAQYGWIRVNIHPTSWGEAPVVKLHGYAVAKPGNSIITGGKS